MGMRSYGKFILDFGRVRVLFMLCFLGVSLWGSEYVVRSKGWKYRFVSMLSCDIKF